MATIAPADQQVRICALGNTVFTNTVRHTVLEFHVIVSCLASFKSTRCHIGTVVNFGGSASNNIIGGSIVPPEWIRHARYRRSHATHSRPPRVCLSTLRVDSIRSDRALIYCWAPGRASLRRKSIAISCMVFYTNIQETSREQHSWPAVAMTHESELRSSRQIASRTNRAAASMSFGISSNLAFRAWLWYVVVRFTQGTTRTTAGQPGV